jgi:nitrate/TMAO reductase-like tetraheme cytochrome c subunit
MIPAIGLMIGAYIFTRMIEIVLQPTANIAVKILAVITVFIVGICVWDLINTAQTVPM